MLILSSRIKYAAEIASFDARPHVIGKQNNVVLTTLGESRSRYSDNEDAQIVTA
jgi:hypothetical protein